MSTFKPGMSVAQKSDAALWARSKELACEQAKLCLHSARKMQWAVRYYKSHGGRYRSRAPSKDNKLKKWTKEKWRTHDGTKSEGKKRYLPSEAWGRLTPSQVRRTNRAKKRGFLQGKQYVRQPRDVAAVASDVRRQRS